jgi:enamine deaminase RidA (YjgF/YER057c/UK114 family)
MTLKRLLGWLLAVMMMAGAAAAELKKQKFQLGDWEQGIGYAQAVRVGNTLHVSGTVGAGAMPDAIKEAFTGLQKTLAAYGLTFQNVVKENIFTTDLEALKQHAAIRREFYGNDFPAATWVQVARLWTPDHVIEVEVTAVFPDDPAPAGKPLAVPATPAPR